MEQKISPHSEFVELEHLPEDRDKTRTPEEEDKETSEDKGKGTSEGKEKGKSENKEKTTSKDKNKLVSEEKDNIRSEEKEKEISETKSVKELQELPELKKVSPISKTQSLSPCPQTSVKSELKSKKIRQSQPSLPIPSDVEDFTSSGSKPSAAKEAFKSDYNLDELRMRLKERPSAALRMMQQSIYLDRVASVGPCVRTLNEGPSGIMIIVPKKSSRVELDPDRVAESKINRIRSRLMTLKQSKIVPRTVSLYGRISTIMRQYVNRIFVPTNTPNEDSQDNDQFSKTDITARDSVLEAEIETN